MKSNTLVLFAVIFLVSLFGILIYSVKYKSNPIHSEQFTVEENGILEFTIDNDSLATVKFVYNKDTMTVKGLYKQDVEYLILFLYDDTRKEFEQKEINISP